MVSTLRRLRAVLSVLVARGAGSVLQLVSNLVLGHVLGATGLGSYFVLLSWQRLLAALVGFGLPAYNLREVAAARTRGTPEAARTGTIRSLLITAAAGMVAAVATLVAPADVLARLGASGSLLLAVRWSGSAAALYAVLRIWLESLKGYGAATTALNVEFGIVPAGLVAIALPLWLMRRQFSIPGVIALHLALLGMSCVVAGALWRARASRSAPSAPATSGRWTFERRALASFWAAGLLNMGASSLPLVLLPRYAAGDADLGQFGLVWRLVGLAGSILVALGSVFAPRFAAAHAADDPTLLRRLLRRSQAWSLAAYIPFFVAFMAVPGATLHAFGPGFAGGRTLLWVMAIGQLVNAATGLSGQLLNMTNRESGALAVIAVSTAAMVGGILWAGPLYGTLGVAIVVSATTALRNVAFLVWGYRSLRPASLLRA